MEVEIVKLLKIFIEKHLIPTTISVVLSFITYFKTTEDSDFIKKFGEMGYSVFIFCIWFLIVECIVYLFKKINYSYINNQVDNKRKELEVLEPIWSEVDNFSNSDYELLMEFIKNGNKPYFESGTRGGDCLLNSAWVYKSKTKFNEKVVEKVYDPLHKDDDKPKEFTVLSQRYQYILKNDVFNILKYSLEHYGKISHFNR